LDRNKHSSLVCRSNIGIVKKFCRIGGSSYFSTRSVFGCFSYHWIREDIHKTYYDHLMVILLSSHNLLMINLWTSIVYWSNIGIVKKFCRIGGSSYFSTGSVFGCFSYHWIREDIHKTSHDHLMVILESSHNRPMINVWTSVGDHNIISQSSHEQLMIILQSSYNHLKIC
jgi:hypothetical protein